jgi:hypothetical protein
MPDTPSPNPWRKSNGRWDWPKIRHAYLEGRWPDFESCARDCQIHPSSQLRKVAGEMGEDWNGQRAALEQKAEAVAVSRIMGRMAREFEKRLVGMLQTADVLRAKGLLTLGNEKMQLNGTEAIRALATATDIEREIFLRRGRAIGGPDDGQGPEGAATATPPGSPGLLPAPASISEIPDAQLIRIIDHKPAKEPKGPRGDLEGRVVEGQDRDHARGSRGRGPAPKGRKG